MALIACFVILWALNPEKFTPGYIAKTITEYGESAWLIYIAATLVRGFFLLPSTPFVIGGTLLFPEHPFWVLFVSMVGVMFSATLLYYFADFLGFSKYLEKKNALGIQKWKDKLQKPTAGLVVLVWSFFPFVPTDIICYVAGLVKMRFLYFFLGVFLGELILNIFYVYYGNDIFQFFI